MDQKKVGSFLKELRKEKGITQEQLAEKLNVSGRSVSRWETGNNMPDISLLVEIADFYDVDVREIIEGERKSEMMNEEVNNTRHDLADVIKRYNDRQAKNREDGTSNTCFIVKPYPNSSILLVRNAPWNDEETK